MKKSLLLSYLGIGLAAAAGAADAPVFDTAWVPTQPEVLTYRSTAKEGNGLYQLSVWRNGPDIELYMNIITAGFTKSVSGVMSGDMRPKESKSRIVINGQVIMTTECAYRPAQLHISTLMSPYNRTTAETIAFTNRVVDFSQGPLVARALPLKVGAEFAFTQLNPQSNKLVPLTLRVTGEGAMQNVECYKVEGADFEGKATYWVEKAGHHRVLRIEQAATGRVTELLL